VVSAMFEHVRWRITVTEVHGGSTFGAETVRDVAPHTIVRALQHTYEESSLYRCQYSSSNFKSRAALVLSTKMHASAVMVLVAPAAGERSTPRRCRLWQEHCRIEASAAEVSS
jgi:hypothetical protein